MARERRLTHAVCTAVLALLAACEAPTDPIPPGDAADPLGWGPSMAVVATLPPVCGDPTEVGLMFGPDTRSGAVRVDQTEDHLYLTFRSETGASILATAVFVGTSPDEIPTTGSGLPHLVKFPYKSGLGSGATEVVWEVPLGDLAGEEVVIAAFAQIGFLPSWGEGEPIDPDRPWPTYFRHLASGCAVETIGSEGGVAATADGRASITVPAGALPSAVDITVEPATVADLIAHVGGGSSATPVAGSGLAPTGSPAGVDEELPTVFGVTPLTGTVWDFGPDGLVFDEPATVTLTYDESALPPEVSEEDLRLFVINGIFEPLSSTVDAEANTVTGEIGHFSYVFVGAGDLEVDLEVGGVTFGDEEPAAGVPLFVWAPVRNNGSIASPGGRIVYEASGDMTFEAEDQSSACEEIDPMTGEVALQCAIPALAVDQAIVMPPILIVPGSLGLPITVSARAFTPAGYQDPEPDNDTDVLEFTVASGPAVDLFPNLTLLPGGDATVGGLLEFRATVFNTGAVASTGGTLLYVVSGAVRDVEAPACTSVTPPPSTDVAFECDVPPLAVFGDFVGETLSVTPDADGDIIVQARVILAPGDRDADPSNNIRVLSVTVTPENQVDLAPFALLLRGSPVVGETVTVDASVFNSGPLDSNGGTFVYSAEGAVSLGPVPAGCEVLAPGTIAIICNVPPIIGGLSAVMPTFSLTILADGVVSVSTRTNTVDPDVDVDPTNNTEGLVFRVGPRIVADMMLQSLTLETATPTAGAPVAVRATVENLGPGFFYTGSVLFFVSAPAMLGELAENCLDRTTGDPTEVGLTIACELPPLDVGAVDASTTVQFIPLEAGPYNVTARVVAGFANSDPDRSNDVVTLSGIEVGPGG